MFVLAKFYTHVHSTVDTAFFLPSRTLILNCTACLLSVYCPSHHLVMLWNDISDKRVLQHLWLVRQQKWVLCHWLTSP